MPWNAERVVFYRGSRASDNAKMITPSDKIAIGVWDMNARAGTLPRLLDAIEKEQSQFSFYYVDAAYQTGLVTPGDHIATEWAKQTGGRMSKVDAAANVLSRPIFDLADKILADTTPRLGWLVVLVKSMIADDANAEPWYNLFSTHRNNVVLLSTYELRRFAAEAGRPFEAAVAGAALSALLAAMIPSIEYQEKTTGSIFDFCETRSDIVRSIRDPKIDPDNRNRLPEEYREPVDQILAILKAYKGETSRSEINRQRKFFENQDFRKEPAPRTAKIPAARGVKMPATPGAKKAAAAGAKKGARGGNKAARGKAFLTSPVAQPSAGFGEILKKLETYAQAPGGSGKTPLSSSSTKSGRKSGSARAKRATKRPPSP